MPIVDGMTSTKMIRSFEKSHPSDVLSARASLNGRVPIFAVSASLIEKDRQTYIDAGFDGWILKPVSFPRLTELMKGIVNSELRNSNVYRSGNWELGGWFEKANANIWGAKTSPSDRIPFSAPSEAAKEAAATGPETSPHQQQQKDIGMEKADG